MKCVNLSLLLTAALIYTGLTAQAQTGISPAHLEVNLSNVNIDGYTQLNNEAVQIAIPACTNATYEACITTNVLASYAAQGVTGVRFFFDLSGALDSTPFSHDQYGNWTVSAVWLNNLSLFFRDLKSANITNITLSPGMSGDSGTWATMGLAFCHSNTDGTGNRVPLGGTLPSPDGRICEAPVITSGGGYPPPGCDIATGYHTNDGRTDTTQTCTWPDILYFPWLPYAVVPFGRDWNGFPYSNQLQYDQLGNPFDPEGYPNAPSLMQDPTLAQYAWGWQDTGCTNWTGYPYVNGSQVTWYGGPLPSGCSPFILLFRQIVRAASLAGLTIEEVDLNNEADLAHWPVTARLIWDNNQYSYQSYPGTGIFDLLSGIMTSLNSGYYAGRVTMSGSTSQYPGLWYSTPQNPNSGSPPHDCASYYGDSQTMIGESEIVAAVGQGNIGVIAYNQDLYKLQCFDGAPQSNLFVLPGGQRQPTINDLHPTPGVPACDQPACGWGSLPPFSTNDVTAVAKTIYSDFWQLLENHSPPRCGNCTDITGNIVMLGETSAPRPAAGSYDPSYTPSTFANAAGLMTSQLASDEYGHNHLSNVVVRPWVNDGDSVDYQIPAQIGWPSGPYNPCGFSASPTSANMSSSAGNGQTWLSESGSCQWTVSSDSPSWLTFSPGGAQAGSENVTYYVAANTGGTRVGHLTVAGQMVTITQQAAQPPAAPSLTGPGNGSSGVSLDPTLAWNGSSGASQYYVYLGTSNPPPLYVVTSGTSYAPSTQLAANTLYYWYVVAYGPGGYSTPSPTWSFTTQPSGPPPSGSPLWQIGVFRADGSQGLFVLDQYGTYNYSSGDIQAFFGLPGDMPVAGNWFGDGVIRIGVFRCPPVGQGTCTWYIDANNDGVWDSGDQAWSFGLTFDLPIVGDWTGDGISKIGVMRCPEPGQGTCTWYLDAGNKHTYDPGTVITASYGLPGDLPVANNWTGGGVNDQIGVFRCSGSCVWIVDSNGDFAYEGTDAVYSYGLPGDYPIVGNWQDNGRKRIGVFRGSFGEVLLNLNGDNSTTGLVGYFGVPGDFPVVGKWTMP